ncbi:MAG: hypothetical protein ACRDYY_14320 [Acidimicrobiales bacterium]
MGSSQAGAGPTSQIRTTAAAVAALARRPDLWRPALRLVPGRWWRRWPPLPAPPVGYRRFRFETMYGDAGAGLDASDLVAYLEWCRRMQRRAR